MRNRKVIRLLTIFCRIVVGLTFVFSGFVKSVDPHGFALKIEEYLSAFHMEFFSFLSLPASFLLCGSELVLGLLLLLGIYPKWTSRLLLLIMGFMTLLTLYLAIADPISDCGCFGDVLILSNWQTFIKNIFLLAFTLYLFFHYGYIGSVFNTVYRKFALGYAVLYALALLAISLSFDSVADFRPYQVGAYLPEKMGETSHDEMEEVRFIYEKKGEQREFNSENYPWQDSSWTFIGRVVSQHNDNISQISDFSVIRYLFDDERTHIAEEIDITGEILQESGYVFLIIVPFLPDIKEREIVKIHALFDYTSAYGYPLYLLTSSLHSDVIEAKKTVFPEAEFCGADEKALRTIIRSYPGVMVLKQGRVVKKWSRPLIPPEQAWDKPFEELPFAEIVPASRTNARNSILCFLLLVIPLGGLKIIQSISYNYNIKSQS